MKGGGPPPIPVEAGQTMTTKELLRLIAQLPAKRFGNAPGAKNSAKGILVCASGKGGVGKSTVSVNLAFMLKRMGLEVGLLDLDVYGPSLPSLVKLPPIPMMQNSQGRIAPLDYGGVALVSWGYIEPTQAAAVRSPILNQMVAQLLTSVDWGLLDILIIDSPPGTGDVLLSLGQTLPVDGAIIVTTANHISLADVLKGVQLFEKLAIPPLLVVANMASLRCEKCGHDQDLFTDSAMEKLPYLLESKGVGLVKIPMDPALSQAPRSPMPPNACKYPFVRNPDNDARPAAAAFRHLAHMALESLLGVTSGEARPGERTTLKLRPGGRLEVRLGSGKLRGLEASEVRAACRCAHCIDEITGEVKIDREAVRRDLRLQATNVWAVGNYAVNVKWSDGHNSVVALRALEQMVGGGAVAWTPPATRDGAW